MPQPSLHLASSYLRAHLTTLREPIRAHVAVTRHCNSRCLTCNIWQEEKRPELTLGDYERFFAANSNLSCLSITGGEPFLRDDLGEILGAARTRAPNLALVNITTNGLTTDRIVRTARRILELGLPKLVIVVSVDGPPALHDEIRGVPGAFDKTLATLQQLLALARRGFDPYAGMTVSPHNLGQVATTFATLAAAIPGLGADTFMATMAHRSRHYYGNPEMDLSFQPQAIAEIDAFFKSRRRRASLRTFMEGVYQRHARAYAKTGRSPVRCRAADVGCYIDTQGLVYPCHIDSTRLANLRDHGFSLAAAADTPAYKAARARIRAGVCEQCWMPCGAMDSLFSQLWRIIA